MAATYNEYTVTVSGSTGTWCDNLYARMVEVLGDDIETVAEFTENSYVYKRFILGGRDDVIFEMDHHSGASSHYMGFNVYIKDPAGSYEILEHTYTKISSASYKVGSTLSTKIRVFKKDDLYFHIMINDGSSWSFGWALVVDICSGEERLAAIDTSKAALKAFVQDGSRFDVSTVGTISNTTDNNYVRMSPTYCYADGFVGHLKDPNLLYYGVTNGAALSINRCTEFTVAGVRFLSLGGGYAIRLEN